MFRKLKRRISFYRNINLIAYIKLNYFSKEVIRIDKSRIIPYKNAIIEIEPQSKVFIKGGDLEIGCDQLRKSKAETRVRIRTGAIWSNSGGCKISYGATIELLPNSLFSNQYFTVNCFSSIIISKQMSFGNDVMIARNVLILDSDFHTIVGTEGNVKNPPKQVVLGDHVWVGANSLILKGSQVGSNSIIAAGTTVRGNICDNTIFYSKDNCFEYNSYGKWMRKAPQ